jgi:hypothetical protein
MEAEMKVKILAAALAALSLATAAAAQAPSPDNLALAEQVLKVSGVEALLKGMLDGPQFRLMDSQIQQLPPAQQAKAKLFQQSVREATTAYLDRMMVQGAQAYATTYTEAELKGLLAFYQSPTGQAFIAKAPTVMAAMNKDIMAEIGGMLQDAMKRYCAKTSCTEDEQKALKPSFS